jgi:ABC-2 type transport system permease protein
MMSIDPGRLAAVARKEVREFRRSPFIIGTMAALPLLLLISPLATIFGVAASARSAAIDKAVGATFLVLLVVPAVIPATIAAYSVVGEREQGTLEPLLTTPVRREELLLGKAMAAIVPAVAIAYLLFTVVQVAAHLFAANPTVATRLSAGPHILAEALFAPLLAAWSIGVGTAVSVRSSDVRVAQQLGTLASLPPLAVTALLSFQVIPASVGVALGFGIGLLVIDVAMWRVVSAMFDRERLITGRRVQHAGGTIGSSPGEVRRITRMGGPDGGRRDT